jgi:hypothetical protein
MIYCPKEKQVSRSELKTEIYQPKNQKEDSLVIPHFEVADMLYRVLKDFEFKTTAERWYVNPTKEYLFGSIDILPSSMNSPIFDLFLFDELGHFSICVRNSYNKKYALSFCSGARLVASNISISYGGEILKKRKASSLHLQEVTEDAVNIFSSRADNFQRSMEKLMNSQLDSDFITARLVDLAKDQLIPWRNLEYITTAIEKAAKAGKVENTFDIYKIIFSQVKRLGIPAQFEFFCDAQETLAFI